MSETKTDENPAMAMLPLRLVSTVVRGYGRGSSDLGIPTANLNRDLCSSLSVPQQSTPTLDDLPTGIYWGFARVGDDATSDEAKDETAAGQSSSIVYTAAISIGYNPTYGNDHKTIEPHLIAPEEDPRRRVSSCGETVLQDFYDLPIRLTVVGYLRPELPFEGLEKLIAAIKQDIGNAVDLAKQHLGNGQKSDSSTAEKEYNWVASNKKL